MIDQNTKVSHAGTETTKLKNLAAAEKINSLDKDEVIEDFKD